MSSDSGSSGLSEVCTVWGSDDWNTIHRRASESGALFYSDPQTGYRVFTEAGLRQRGRCCGSGCRHCPWQHQGMPLSKRIAHSRQPSWLTVDTGPALPVDLLFWSGGKDSFLALRSLEREAVRPVVLLTTFDTETRIIAHQEILIDDAVRQARQLGIPLLGIPLYSGQSYPERIREGCALIPHIERFVFGDLHLEHIREWRQTALQALARERELELHFPLWGVPWHTLMSDLEESGVPCIISAVTEAATDFVRVGDRFDRELIGRLPSGIDPFGEHGEFHTLVRLWEKNG